MATPQPIAADQVIGNLQFTVQNASESSTALINSFGLVDVLASSGGNGDGTGGGNGDGTGGGNGDGTGGSNGDGTGGGTDSSLVLSALEAEFGIVMVAHLIHLPTGSLGSQWNFGNVGGISVTDGNLVVGGVNGEVGGGQTYRKMIMEQLHIVLVLINRN